MINIPNHGGMDDIYFVDGDLCSLMRKKNKTSFYEYTVIVSLFIGQVPLLFFTIMNPADRGLDLVL